MARARNVILTKASGVEQRFDPEKVYNSLINSGASPDVADKVIHLLVPEIKPGMHTKKIYRLAHKFLKHIDKPSGMRYSLKDAIYALGPTGYPFEQYIARLFKAHGYKTKVGQLIKAYVVLQSDARGKISEEEVMEFCRQNLAHYKVPRIIEFRGELPKTDVGKVSRRELREESEEG